MGQLEDLQAFVQIVEQGSIGKAAEQAGVAKSAMSRKLKLLEERMQAVLIARTTRQWSLTEAGREYYERGLGVITAFEEFESQVRNDNRALTGEIKISVPLYFGRVNLTPHLIKFAKQHPDVHLNIEFSDRIVDVISEQFDLVVRISEMPDSSLIARQLCETRHLYCTSPAYIADNESIEEPRDLQRHRIIQFGPSKRMKWHFKSAAGKQISVPLSPAMNTHDGEFLIEAAEQGLGIIRVPDFLAQSSIDSGKLMQVLSTYELTPRGIYLVYPTARYLPHRTRALTEYLLEHVTIESAKGQ